MTANEVAKSLKMDISTAFRYLDQMARKGLLRVIHTKEGDRFDLASEHIMHILEEASVWLKESGKFDGNAVFHYILDAKELPRPDFVLDMRGEMCPIPDLQTKKTTDADATGPETHGGSGLSNIEGTNIELLQEIWIQSVDHRERYRVRALYTKACRRREQRKTVMNAPRSTVSLRFEKTEYLTKIGKLSDGIHLEPDDLSFFVY
jgi:hypothetical protein